MKENEPEKQKQKINLFMTLLLLASFHSSNF